jgi:hypothetical protein
MNESKALRATQVIAQFDEEGKITPLRFNWQGQMIAVTSSGRRWEDEVGQHILVMVPGERIFELIFIPAELRWYLRSQTGSILAA